MATIDNVRKYSKAQAKEAENSKYMDQWFDEDLTRGQLSVLVENADKPEVRHPLMKHFNELQNQPYFDDELAQQLSTKLEEVPKRSRTEAEKQGIKQLDPNNIDANIYTRSGMREYRQRERMRPINNFKQKVEGYYQKAHQKLNDFRDFKKSVRRRFDTDRDQSYNHNVAYTTAVASAVVIGFGKMAYHGAKNFKDKMQGYYHDIKNDLRDYHDYKQSERSVKYLMKNDPQKLASLIDENKDLLQDPDIYRPLQTYLTPKTLSNVSADSLNKIANTNIADRNPSFVSQRIKTNSAIAKKQNEQQTQNKDPQLKQTAQPKQTQTDAQNNKTQNVSDNKVDTKTYVSSIATYNRMLVMAQKSHNKQQQKKIMMNMSNYLLDHQPVQAGQANDQLTKLYQDHPEFDEAQKSAMKAMQKDLSTEEALKEMPKDAKPKQNKIQTDAPKHETKPVTHKESAENQGMEIDMNDLEDLSSLESNIPPEEDDLNSLENNMPPAEDDLASLEQNIPPEEESINIDLSDLQQPATAQMQK